MKIAVFWKVLLNSYNCVKCSFLIGLSLGSVIAYKEALQHDKISLTFIQASIFLSFKSQNPTFLEGHDHFHIVETRASFGSAQSEKKQK